MGRRRGNRRVIGVEEPIQLGATPAGLKEDPGIDCPEQAAQELHSGTADMAALHVRDKGLRAAGAAGESGLRPATSPPKGAEHEANRSIIHEASIATLPHPWLISILAC